MPPSPKDKTFTFTYGSAGLSACTLAVANSTYHPHATFLEWARQTLLAQLREFPDASIQIHRSTIILFID